MEPPQHTIELRYQLTVEDLARFQTFHSLRKAWLVFPFAATFFLLIIGTVVDSVRRPGDF